MKLTDCSLIARNRRPGVAVLFPNKWELPTRKIWQQNTSWTKYWPLAFKQCRVFCAVRALKSRIRSRNQGYPWLPSGAKPTNSELPRWRTGIQKLTVAQLVNSFTTYQTITVFTKSRHWSPSWASWIQPSYSHPVSLRSMLVFTFQNIFLLKFCMYIYVQLRDTLYPQKLTLLRQQAAVARSA
jgi:hypothetical protein